MIHADVFTLDTHCYVCHKIRLHRASYRIDRKAVLMLVECSGCQARSRVNLDMKTLAYMTIHQQWGLK